jgi:hypothetical protein
MSDTQTVLELINKVAEGVVAGKAEANFDQNKPFAVVPQGYQVADLTEYAEHLEQRGAAPRRVSKRMRFVDVTSFLVYFQKFRTGHNPQLFNKLSSSGLHVMGVFDYDEAQGGEAPATIVPTGTRAKWGDNVAYLSLAYSRDYKQLRELADKWFKQDEFALFVEENLHLFVQPNGATMFELAQHLKGKRNVEWESGKRLGNSSTQLSYIETIDATTVRGEPLTVPDYLLLRLPMYEGFSEQEVKLAFRWRLNQEKEINFSYRLLTKVAERQAEQEVKQRIEGTTELPLLTVSSFNGLTPNELD